MPSFPLPVFPVNERIAIVLVQPENPDNIGAVCRAMKNMGLKDLRLVNPPADWLTKSEKMAVSAHDLLKSAKVFYSLPKAVEDRRLVVGTTRRGGPRRGFFVKFHEAMEMILKEEESGCVAILFGRESKGLDNDSLSQCNWVTTIPVHPSYPSINLAQAVMVVAFKLFERRFENADLFQFQSAALNPKRGRHRAAKAMTELPNPLPHLMTQSEVEETLDRFEIGLRALGYSKSKDILPRIRKTFGGLLKRSGLLEREAQMLKGIARRISERARRSD